MSFGVVHHFPGGTKEQYEAIVAKIAPDDKLPPGELHHVAGPTEQGWLVSVVFESKEKYDEFFSGTLGPVLTELGDKAFPNPPSISTFEVHRELHS